MHLVSLGQVRNTPLLSQRFQGDLRLQRCIDLPSRFLHHPLRLARRNGSRSNYPAGPKSRVHFTTTKLTGVGLSKDGLATSLSSERVWMPTWTTACFSRTTSKSMSCWRT